jgi:hypothetical protein
MDVWRYSDWYGRRGVNDVRNSYPHIWRWRDWIVRSLNEDKGYDRMVAEMLAADEIDPGNDESAVATGYLVRSWFSMNYNVWMKDLVEHTGKAFRPPCASSTGRSSPRHPSQESDRSASRECRWWWWHSTESVRPPSDGSKSHALEERSRYFKIPCGLDGDST